MKPFRKNVAIAIDGGGIRGIVVTQALTQLEAALGQTSHQIFRLAVGTSTGSIIAAGIGAGLSAAELNELYLKLGPWVFPSTWRKTFFPLTKYRYPEEPLKEALTAYFGEKRMGDYWIEDPATDVVITAYDLVENRTRFIKPWKNDYASWPVKLAVQGSCTVPTYFPVVEGRYIDGGVGSYANPCYVAAYEAALCLNWDPTETTLISLGTGREPHKFNASKAIQLFSWQWLGKMFGAFLQSAYDQQVHLVETYFKQLDFRRFQVDMIEPIEMDDIKQIPKLVEYGKILGEKILTDEVDHTMGFEAKMPQIKRI